MGTPGKTVLTTSGKRGLLSSGKGAVFNASGECAACCGGESDCSVWGVGIEMLFYPYAQWPFGRWWEYCYVYTYLTSYQNNPVLYPRSKWRIAIDEIQGEDSPVVILEGDIDENGIAIGLPTLIWTYSGETGLSLVCRLVAVCSAEDFASTSASGEIVVDDRIHIEY